MNFIILKTSLIQIIILILVWNMSYIIFLALISAYGFASKYWKIILCLILVSWIPISPFFLLSTLFHNNSIFKHKKTAWFLACLWSFTVWMLFLNILKMLLRKITLVSILIYICFFFANINWSITYALYALNFYHFPALSRILALFSNYCYILPCSNFLFFSSTSCWYDLAILWICLCFFYSNPSGIMLMGTICFSFFISCS